MIGNTDKPIEEFRKDEFDISSYVIGLSEFIKECETPMTVAIQGDWGSGKTSMMNMVRDNLNMQESIIDVWFNTWQFSQFNMDEQLILTFLRHLIKQLAKVIKDEENKQKICAKMGSIMKTIAVGMTKHFVGEDFAETVDCIIANEKETDEAYEIMELKQSFQDLVSEAYEVTKRRVVIFIDDLDRLQPVRAVELLEVLKLFVDCENCVFVMAIDTSVVFQGIREKYGTDITDEKAQSFFDKLIQLPFKMPVVYYKLDGMIQRLLGFLQADSLPKEEREKYIKLIRKTTAGNPRSIKRLINSFLLVDNVAIQKKIYSNEPQLEILSKKLFLVLSCLQMKYDVIYEFLVKEMSYRLMSQIYDFRIPQDDAERFEILVNWLKSIGVPEVSIIEKDTFYDIIIIFIKTCKAFINKLYCENVGNYNKTEAIHLLIQVISLNGLISDNEESNLIKNTNFNEKNDDIKKTESMIEDIASLYTGKIALGKSMEVYRKLTEKKIFPCLSKNMRSDNDRIEDVELEEYKKRRLLAKDFFLYKEIDKVLEKSYEKSERILDDGYVYITYSYIIKNISYYGDSEFKVKMVYNESQQFLKCSFDSFSLKNYIVPKVFKEMCEFVEGLKKDYNELIQNYGEKIFPKQEIYGMPVVEEVYDTQGKIVGYQKIDFGIVSKKMADRVVDFLITMVNRKEEFFGEAKEQSINTFENESDNDINVILARIRKVNESLLASTEPIKEI